MAKFQWRAPWLLLIVSASAGVAAFAQANPPGPAPGQDGLYNYVEFKVSFQSDHRV
jgi:hypothetical protein